MSKSKISIFLTIGIIFFLSYKFYFHKWLGYESIPNTYIFDEHDYPFVGYSFRKTGIPTGWSTMEVYKELDDKKENNKNIQFDGISITADGHKPSISNKDDFNYPVTQVIDVDIGKGTETIRIVQPFFDHPIVGSWIYSLGIKEAEFFDDLTPSNYRRVSLFLSIVTGILIFIFSYLLFKDLLISFLSFIIYSIVPKFVLMSRFALLENIVIPLSLVSLSLIYAIQKSKNRSTNLFLLLSGIFSGLAFLTKESGAFVFITILIILISEKFNFKKILVYFTPIILLPVVYYSYMYYLSPDLFSKLLFDQANREWFGPLSFFFQIIQPNFSGFPKSGYWLFGIISIFILYIKNQKKYLKLFLPFIIYILVFLFMGGLNYPWYYLPLIPFIVIASAVLIKQLILKPNLSTLALFYLLVFSSSFYWGYFVFHSNQNNYFIYRMTLFAFIIMFCIRKFKITKIYNLLWLIFSFLVLSQIYQWNQQGFQFIISNWNHLPTNFSFPV